MQNKQKLFPIIFSSIFWLIILFIMLLNYQDAARYFKYDMEHDHHMAFISWLGGMAANGHFAGIDFYSPHSIFVPLILGIFFKILGVSQVNLGLSIGFLNFLSLFFIYKTSRFVLNDKWGLFSKIAILALLLWHGGRDLPWFNDVIMAFVSLGVYIFASYLNNPSSKYAKYKLIALGIIIFMLPYLRQQGLIISVAFLIMPILLFYTKQIQKAQYERMIRILILTFITANAAFFAFVFLKNGLNGFEILFTSLTKLVDMAQPTIAYNSGIADIANKALNYTAERLDWHGYYLAYVSYWFMVIIPAIYFAYRPLVRAFDISSLASNVESIANSIRFMTALIVLSTIVFNYPINEDARMKVGFGIGIWLFIDALILAFYNKNTKIISISAILVILLIINFTKIIEFSKKTIQSYDPTAFMPPISKHYNKNYTIVESQTPYKKMRFRKATAERFDNLISAIRKYSAKFPEKAIVFDGELVGINSYFYLLFSGPKIALAHKFPYYYGKYDRKEIFSEMDEKFSEFIEANKPIIIGCKDNKEIKNYQILENLNEYCNILVPMESSTDLNQESSPK